MTSDRPKVPDIIATAQASIESPAPDDELKNLVGAAKRAKPIATAPTPIPAGYHSQIPPDTPTVRYKKPTRSERRSLVVNMRLSVVERDRFYSFCEDRNLSLPDGLVALMDGSER